MSVDISLSQRVQGTPDQVASFAMDPANDARWMEGVEESHVEGDGPLAVGSRVRRRVRAAGHDLSMLTEVTALQPGELLELRSLEQMAPVRFRYAFAPLDGAGTLVTMSVDGEVTAGGMTGYFIRRALEKSVAASLRNLHDLMESGERGG